MYLYDRKMVAITNHTHANLSSNNIRHMMVQDLKKIQNRKFPNFSHSVAGRVEANNNRETVLMCAPHLVKRPSKRSASMY